MGCRGGERRGTSEIVGRGLLPKVRSSEWGKTFAIRDENRGKGAINNTTGRKREKPVGKSQQIGKTKGGVPYRHRGNCGIWGGE